MNLFNPTTEHQILRKTLKDFIIKEVEPQALEHDREEKFNLSLFKKLGKLGLLGLTVEDENLGGMSMDASALCIVHEELSSSDPGFCLAYLAHSVLCVHNLDQNASIEQKKKWLPKLCSGQWIGSMAMSEPSAGTDVLAMQTQAQRQKEFYIIKGHKMWITNGVIDKKNTLADACLLYTSLKGGEKRSLCSFFVEKNFKGFSAGQNIKNKAGMRASMTSELIFDHCQIPICNRIGEEGRAIYSMMKNLEIERLALAAMSLGIAKRALKEMNRYASERRAFNQSIRSFGQIQKYLAESFSEFYSCRTYIYDIARRFDFKKGKHKLESDSAKLLASQMGKKVADRAIQVMGGYGYVGEYCVERLWRDAKLLEIGGGTIEALQKNITKELENEI